MIPIPDPKIFGIITALIPTSSLHCRSSFHLLGGASDSGEKAATKLALSFTLFAATLSPPPLNEF